MRGLDRPVREISFTFVFTFVFAFVFVFVFVGARILRRTHCATFFPGLRADC